MNKQDRQAHKMAEGFERQRVQKVERSKLSQTIKQIANSVDESLGTPAERKIMACKVLMPEYDLSVTEWCQHAGITRATWYNALHRPSFGERCCSVAKTIFGPQSIEIAGALARKARLGGIDGMGDTTAAVKILQQVEVVDKEDSGYRNYSDDELRRIAREALGIVSEQSDESDREQPRITEAS